MKQWIALAISIVLLLGMTACSSDKREELGNNPGVNTTQDQAQEITVPTTQTVVEPVEMDSEALSEAYVRTEFQMVAAALQAEETRKKLSDRYYSDNTAYYGNIDNDSELELLYGSNALCFDISEGKQCSGGYAPSGFTYYIDKNGVFYTHCYYESELSAYKAADGTNISIEEIWVGKEESIKNITINGSEISSEEFDSYLEELDLQPITDQSLPFTAYNYDICYSQSLIDGLDQYFRSNFDQYRGRFSGDFDGDGLEETLFLIPGYMDPWLDDVDLSNELMSWAVTSSISVDTERTAVILADPKDSEICIQTHCVEGSVSVLDTSDISYSDSCLFLGELCCYVPSVSNEDAVIYNGLNKYWISQGYTDITIKAADLNDAAGKEFLLLGNKDGNWTLLIFVIRNGVPFLAYKDTLEKESYFITEYEGKPVLLIYGQTVNKNAQNTYSNHYNYQIVQFDNVGASDVIERKRMSYTVEQESAADAAEFFDALSTYMGKIIVIYDPFALNGKTWLKAEEVDFGAPPIQESEGNTSQEQSTQEQLGFVSIQNPDSWLHLRVGPGLEYDKVLIDPQDPNSFVRQALGSPVTILETVEVDNDPENPVWVKIRIRYEGMDIIGYSSKTYIRLAEES